MAATRTVIEIPDALTVREFSALMGITPIDVIKELMKSGIMANINQQIDFDTMSIVAEELGFEVTSSYEDMVEAEARLEELPEWRQVLAQERERDLQTRPPVVTIMGHVDHGKTSLLDVIRRTRIADGEAGGITQHIAAYQAKYEGNIITFLDTPGHAAFTSMRARGAQATDIAVLVVAADDGIMPQTREAIDHARAAHVPIIVALNKIDLPNANIPKVLQQLNEVGLVPDEWGGDTLVIQVSAKQDINIDELLEAILLTAEELNPRANPKAEPTGVVIEAKVERGRGATATLLVQNGTLKVGDTLLIGLYYGRIKAMYNFRGKRIKKAGPSTPIAVSGLNGVPGAGDLFDIVKNEKEARKIVADYEAEMSFRKNMRGPSLEDFMRDMQGTDNKVLRLIIKADVQGSIEPIVSSIQRMEHEEVDIDIMRAAAGAVTESDVMLASASDAIILGFNVGTDPAATRAANSDGVDIKHYKIIYNLFKDIEDAINGMLDPIYEMKLIGRAEIRAVFRIKNAGNIAGCFMRSGKAQRNATARLIRGSRLMTEAPLASLKRFQENVLEVREGFEFGVNLRNWNNYREGDVIEFFVEERVR